MARIRSKNDIINARIKSYTIGPAKEVQHCKDVTKKIISLEDSNKSLTLALERMKNQRDDANLQTRIL